MLIVKVDSRLMAEREALLDAILVRWMDQCRACQTAAAFRVLGLEQMPFACARTQYFAACRNFETFGGGLLRFNPFWASHKSNPLSKKERAIYGGTTVEARGFSTELRN
jgi:hypothetical protein